MGPTGNHGDELRRDGIEFPTFDPKTGQTFMSRMRFARLKYLATKSKGFVMEGVELVKQILASPGAVFEGLKREKDEEFCPDGAAGWRCYCGIPTHKYLPSGATAACPPNQMLMVFISDDSVVYFHCWGVSDPQHQEIPFDRKDRFVKQIYPKTEVVK